MVIAKYTEQNIIRKTQEEIKTEELLAPTSAPASWNLAGKKLKNIFQIAEKTILGTENPKPHLDIISDEKMKSIELPSSCLEVIEWPDKRAGNLLLCECKDNYALIDSEAGKILSQISKTSFNELLNEVEAARKQMVVRPLGKPRLENIGFVKSPNNELLFMVSCGDIPIFLQLSADRSRFKMFTAWKGARNTWVIADDMETLMHRGLDEISFYTFNKGGDQKEQKPTVSVDKGVSFNKMRSLPGGGYVCFDACDDHSAVDGTFTIVDSDFKVIASRQQIAPIGRVITLDKRNFVCTFDDEKEKSKLICAFEHLADDKINMKLYEFPEKIAKIIANPTQAQLICLSYDKDDKLVAQVVNNFKPLLKYKHGQSVEAESKQDDIDQYRHARLR